jgi:glycerol-3-phosphate dehydrogenase
MSSPTLRQAVLDRLPQTPFDVLVVGGGINGAVSAAALAARGARVALLERGDFASATSQESSCLIWGGIKYLESFELGLVRKLCRARNQLLRAYPSSVREVRFYAAHARGFRRGRLTLAAGTWLYWALGGFFTRPPRLLSRARMEREEPCVDLEGVDGGFEYSDAYLPDGDARFVWGFVRGALDEGCAAANYVEVLDARRSGDTWVATARDRVRGRTLEVRARVLVNACGPYADALNARNGIHTAHHHVLSKGIHLLVPRVAPGPRVLTFFADDGRLFFAIPQGSATCIGTTDTPVDDPDVEVTPDDRRFVLENINKRLRLGSPLTEGDVIAERCGVRPLAVEEGGARARDWMQLSRRHAIDTDAERAHVTIFGGKLTDCLNVGERICAEASRLGVALPEPRRRWFGEPPAAAREEFLHQAARMGLADGPAAAGTLRSERTPDRVWEQVWERLWRRHGLLAPSLLDAIRRDARAAEVVLPGTELLRCELELMAGREMIVELEDLLRRRTRIALSIRREALLGAPELREVCRALFGPGAEDALAAFRSAPAAMAR